MTADHHTAYWVGSAAGRDLFPTPLVYNQSMCVFLTAMLCAATQAVVPLNQQQQTQVDSATDFSGRFDEGALYPLLHNALGWQDRDETGAVVPDYPSLFEQPALHRGQLFLIEGLFAGVPRDGSLAVAGLTRAGPWDDKLQQWVVVVDQQRDEVAVVYLVDPPPAPPAGTDIRLVARFYKVLSDTDRQGRPTDYLTFVGKNVVLGQITGRGGSAMGFAPLVGALLLLAGGWYVLRRTVYARPLRRPIGAGRKAQGDQAAPGDEGAGVPLPKNPADALSALNQMRDEEDR